jgi:hypothetical protein
MIEGNDRDRTNDRDDQRGMDDGQIED